jgi:DNA-binding response OmpR family regulator
VLLVEDEPEILGLVNEILSGQGYTVLQAGTGNTALRLAERHSGPIHLLFTDVVMPGMSGRVLAERLTSLRPDVRVIYTSGYTDDAILRHGLRTEGLNFLQKPFRPEALLHKVREVLNTPEGPGV